MIFPRHGGRTKTNSRASRLSRGAPNPSQTQANQPGKCRSLVTQAPRGGRHARACWPACSLHEFVCRTRRTRQLRPHNTLPTPDSARTHRTVSSSSSLLWPKQIKSENQTALLLLFEVNLTQPGLNPTSAALPPLLRKRRWKKIQATHETTTTTTNSTTPVPVMHRLHKDGLHHTLP